MALLECGKSLRAELEELQDLLHFPEEVALRLADSEYELFYQVAPIEFLRQVTLDLGGSTNNSQGTATGGITSDALPPSNSSTVRSSVATLIKRFNEVSAWVTKLIISQPTHDARRAVLSCVLRVALFSWNIGNFNGAMEIIAGLKSNKLKPFWLSITEKETLPVLDFLSAALLSAEYDRALSRALGMAECPVVPFFGAFLRELRDILASGNTESAASASVITSAAATGCCNGTQTMPDGGVPSLKPSSKAAREKEQCLQRQVFISEYDGEDQHFTKIGPGGLMNLERIYRTQAVMDHISSFHQHYHSRQRLYTTSPAPTPTLFQYLKQNSATSRILANEPCHLRETDEEYDFHMDDYRPVQPLVYDHGVSLVPLSSRLWKIDQHVIQIMHHGSTAVIWEGTSSETSQASAARGLLYLRLDRSCTTLTWVRPSWSGLRAGSNNESGDMFSTDFNLSFNPEEMLSPGLLTKWALQSSGEQSSGMALDDGFLDIMNIKEVHLGGRDAEREFELVSVCRRFGLKHEAGNECALTILYGYALSDNKLLYIVCPSTICRVWYSGLSWLIRGTNRLLRLTDKRLLWLKEQYMQLYHEDGYCCGPLAADAIRTFGGKDWSLAGMAQSGSQATDPSGLRREVSMKIKKKQILNNQAFKDKSLKAGRGEFVEPATMGMESSYWRSPIHHRQSTPTTFPDHQPDVSRHHSLGHLATGNSSLPKLERERHGSTEHLWHGRHPRVGSVLYDTQLDFLDFVTLFRSFSILIRKDLRDLFEQLAISYRSVAVNTIPKVMGAKLKVEQAAKRSQRLGLLTRNHHKDMEGMVSNNAQKKIYDAIAASSIFTNCAGIDTNNTQIITLSTFTKFLESRQSEVWMENDVKSLIQRHEPDSMLRAQHCLSFEGFARYLMDKDNYAFVNEHEVPNEMEMSNSLSSYYIACSHNTYLTGHQLKGESSVDLYGQILLDGCRCVELDCWDGEDGYPMIYHGHTFTTKIPFNAVVECIDRNAFVTSPYPVILSIENHCSLQQQTRMAHIFQKVFGNKLVASFLFDADKGEDPVLPSPEQLRHRILIKNKKLNAEVYPTLSSNSSGYSSSRSSGGGFRHSIPGRTSSIISNASSSSFNDDYSDDDFEDDEDDENIDDMIGEKGGIQMTTPSHESSKQISTTCNTYKSSSMRKVGADDKFKRRNYQISKELSDIVIYVQAIKFRGLNIISPHCSVKQKQPSSSSSNPSSNSSNLSATPSKQLLHSDTLDASSIASIQQEMDLKRQFVSSPCYQCCSINENTSKKLCRKQPLAVVAHTETQLMRTYPAGMRIDSSNFNPVIFWSFGIQMAALNYQTDDMPMHINSAMFEQNGKCGFVKKPPVMCDKSHVMYRRFNPWDKQFDGFHSTQITINVISGQFIAPSSVNLNTYVEVEIIGIPIDCNKQKSKIIQKNALNPIWNDSFRFRVMFRDLAFLRFAVFDGSNNHLLAQRLIPLKCLRSGYRHLRLRSAQNKFMHMSTLFLYSSIEEESLDKCCDKDEPPEEAHKTKAANTAFVGISGTPLCLKRRMFFLMVYGVVAEEPYTILKITQESSTRDVLELALHKAGISADKINDFILVEEVARGWEKKDHNLPATQRVLDLLEHPLQAQGQWKGDGKFVLKRMGDDPSSRAWLTSVRSVANREREARNSNGSTAGSNAWEENDTFLVCIYNVSHDIPYAILKVPLIACAQDVLAQSLLKARRMEDPMNFVLVEELEWSGTSNNLQFRSLGDFENVYSAQSHWKTIGRFIMQERGNATPASLKRNRISSLRLVTIDRISKGFNVARTVATSTIKVPVHVALGEPNTSGANWKSKSIEETRKNRLIRNKGGDRESPVHVEGREFHSEGEMDVEDEPKESDILSTVSRLKKVSLRRFRDWKL